ncbi:hypothetical protein U3A71_004552 [Salmonella enterica]|nr:hypothetical protein [Salmonella enterica]
MAEWKEKRQEWLVTDPGADMKIRERGVNKMTLFDNLNGLSVNNSLYGYKDHETDICRN